MSVNDGGMATNVRNNDFYGCPPWIDEKLWRIYRRKYKIASNGSPALMQLDLEINDTCNYKCIECPISIENERRNNLLSIDDSKEIIRNAAKHGIECLKLNYINEPLLKVDEIVNLAKYAKSLGILDIYFTTNGSLLTRDNAIKIVKSDTISRIQVSLDATNEITYNKIRRGGNFKNVVQNINGFLDVRKELKTNWPKIRVSFLNLPENQGESNNFIRQWEHKVDAVALQSSVLSPNSKRAETELFKKEIRTAKCPNPFRQLVIRANKDILPCCSFWGNEMPLGKYSEDVNILDIFNSKNMHDLRDSFEIDRELSEICRQCLSSMNPSDI